MKNVRFGVYNVITCHLDIVPLLAMSYADALNVYGMKHNAPAVGVSYDGETACFALDTDTGTWEYLE